MEFLAEAAGLLDINTTHQLNLDERDGGNLTGTTSNSLPSIQKKERQISSTNNRNEVEENGEADGESIVLVRQVCCKPHPFNPNLIFTGSIDAITGQLVHGKTLCAATGEVYEGRFGKNGKCHGEGGVLVRPDGSKFLGRFENGDPREGTWITEDFTYTGTLIVVYGQSEGEIPKTQNCDFSDQKMRVLKRTDSGSQTTLETVTTDSDDTDEEDYDSSSEASFSHASSGSSFYDDYDVEENFSTRTNNSDETLVIDNTKSGALRNLSGGIHKTNELSSGVNSEEPIKKLRPINLNLIQFQKENRQLWETNHRHPTSLINVTTDKSANTLTSKDKDRMSKFLLFHGMGTLVKQDGNIYSGEFYMGRPHGAGKETLPDGSSYTGEFQNGRRHGIGTTFHPSSSAVADDDHDETDSNETDPRRLTSINNNDNGKNRADAPSISSSSALTPSQFSGTIHSGVWYNGKEEIEDSNLRLKGIMDTGERYATNSYRSNGSNRRDYHTWDLLPERWLGL